MWLFAIQIPLAILVAVALWLSGNLSILGFGLAYIVVGVIVAFPLDRVLTSRLTVLKKLPDPSK